MKEIQGNQFWFELARVRVIGSRQCMLTTLLYDVKILCSVFIYMCYLLDFAHLLVSDFIEMVAPEGAIVIPEVRKATHSIVQQTAYCFQLLGAPLWLDRAQCPYQTLFSGTKPLSYTCWLTPRWFFFCVDFLHSCILTPSKPQLLLLQCKLVWSPAQTVHYSTCRTPHSDAENRPESSSYVHLVYTSL